MDTEKILNIKTIHHIHPKQNTDHLLHSTTIGNYFS